MGFGSGATVASPTASSAVAAALLLLCSCTIASSSPTPSPGCRAAVLPAGQRHRLPLNKTVMRNVTLTDRNRLTRNRRYAIHLPSSYDFASPRPLPLLVYFHGQTGTAKGDIGPYTRIGEREGFITVSGQGMDDGNCGTGWNVGATGLNDTCTREACEPRPRPCPGTAARGSRAV